MTWQIQEVTVRGRCTGVTASDDGCRDGNASDFMLISSPRVGTAVYWGVARKGTGCGMEWGA